MTRTFALLLIAAVSLPASANTGAKVGGPIGPDGTQVQLDLPESLHTKNRGGSDGAGLCVFTSIQHTAAYNGIPLLQDFQKYMTRFPGGGWPEKVTAYVNRVAKERGEDVPAFIHVETSTAAALDLLALATKTGRMPGVTYSWSPTGRYGGSRIAHMVSLVHARHGPQKLWAILDNNYIGREKLEWMTEQEFARTYAGGRGQGWAVIFLAPSPPPVPTAK